MVRPQSTTVTKVRAAATMCALALIASLGAFANGNADAAQPPAPTAISAAASTDNGTLGGAVPDVLVQAGSPFTLTVTLQPAGAAFKADTTLDLTVSLSSGAAPQGTLSPASVVMPAGASTATFPVSYAAVDNGVQVTAAVASTKGRTSDVAPGRTAAFDVLKVLKTFAANDPQLATGLGVGNASCAQTTTESACGTLVLPHAVVPTTTGALSLGACTPDLRCTSGSQVVQVVADLGALYSPEDPALLIYRCDKQLCPGKGLKNYTLKVSFAASGPLTPVAPCVSKGVARDAAGNTFCTDYVQSHRDNSGDLLLRLLFTHDMRGST